LTARTTAKRQGCSPRFMRDKALREAASEAGGMPTSYSEAVCNAVTASLRLAAEKAVEDLWNEPTTPKGT
jgi:hypothetical protein